jgi:hypothetical protein
MSAADPVALILAAEMLAMSPLSSSLHRSYLPPPYRLRGCLYSLRCRPYLSPRRLPYKYYTSLLPLCILPSPCGRLNTHPIPAFGTLLLYRLLLRTTKPIAAPTLSTYLSILLALYPT